MVRQTEHLLLGEGVYNHVSNGMDPTDYIKFAVEMPQPLFPDMPMSCEKEEMQKWITDDGLAESIILRKVSFTVLSIIPDDVSITTWEVWAVLANLYD